MKIGLNISIDVTKIDKSRIKTHKNGGKYVSLTAFIDTDNVSRYGDNGTISQATSQEERQAGVKLPIVGNARVFYTSHGHDGNDTSCQKNQNTGYQSNQNNVTYEDNVPF